ncbi:MAG: HTTM domain-containing protein [Alphaproteobacteria bacterium]|nr:HTTM domain-containing protein [Alphaproteobacteria bacterium]MCB9792343.1 HTTM domain-containing protein [Alphaproteobacteria bacterium]
MSGPSARHFALFRIALGAWLALHFLRLLPYAAEVYSAEGLFPDMQPFFWIVFPTPLRWLDSPRAAQAFLAVSAGLGALLALGVRRPWVCVALWFCLASGAARNFMSFNLSMNYMGWVLLAMALTPEGEGWSLGERGPRPGFGVPPTLVKGLWAILGLSYSVSGYVKLGLPEWTQGLAVQRLLVSGVAREGPVNALMLALPEPALSLASWFVLGLELIYLPLVALRWTRPWAWAAMVGMHLVIGSTTRITELSLSMILVHLLVFDPSWLGLKMSSRSQSDIKEM